MDPENGQRLASLDCEMQTNDKDGAVVRDVFVSPFRLHASAGTLYLTSQARNLAVRLWERDGKPGFAQAWESNYGSSGFGNVFAPAMATDRYLFTWHSSLAHTPHSPDPRAEVDVQDARNGRWIARLKPVMDDLYSYGPLNLSVPVVAGKYLFLLGGRADNTRNQIAVVSADERLQLIARQDVEPGTTQPPVFARDRMLLRSPGSLLCIAATTPEGRQHEKLELARTLLRVIGAEPRAAAGREVPRLDGASTLGNVPIGQLTPERPTDLWLGAGPCAPGDLGDAAALAALRPESGTPIAGKEFAPLGRQLAYNEPPAYIRTSELQGTGDIMPRFITRVDPKCVSGPNEAGLLYTVLNNPRDRIVVPSLARKGITQWLGGRQIDSGERLHLAPGLYPCLVRVGPEFYEVQEQEILPPVRVVEALAKGKLSDIGWPKVWQVLGPLHMKDSPLTAEQLRTMADRVVVDGHAHRLFPFAADDHAVELGCLTRGEIGVEPDRALQFVRPGQPLTAYAFASIDCPADGYLYVTASCDNCMRWYVDGASVYDRMKLGNAAKPTDLDAHPFAVRVARGRHVLAVQLAPSSSGWNFRSLGGFSEKRGDELPDFRVDSKQLKEVADFRLQPCFEEVPHTPTLRRMWVGRIRANVDRLRAVVEDLPGTPEAQTAAALLGGAAASSD